jgi:hypothetical protein
VSTFSYIIFRIQVIWVYDVYLVSSFGPVRPAVILFVITAFSDAHNLVRIEPFGWRSP